MTWGVNLGLDNATNAANMATSILGAFHSPQVKQARVYLDLIEIGEWSFFRETADQIHDSYTYPDRRK